MNGSEQSRFLCLPAELTIAIYEDLIFFLDSFLVISSRLYRYNRNCNDGLTIYPNTHNAHQNKVLIVIGAGEVIDHEYLLFEFEDGPFEPEDLFIVAHPSI